MSRSVTNTFQYLEITSLQELQQERNQQTPKSFFKANKWLLYANGSTTTTKIGRHKQVHKVPSYFGNKLLLVLVVFIMWLQINPQIEFFWTQVLQILIIVHMSLSTG